ncbi:MAG: hypothetical protein E7651_06895 [Ruminococcaceae bacterium]|nr:hypothetical protein [Oscillospiraceae bacterium]MBQ8325090.1 hypothetical protein [Clostridia bacterium]
MKRTLPSLLLCALLLGASHASAREESIPSDALVTYGYLQKELDALREEFKDALAEEEAPLPLPSVPALPLRPLQDERHGVCVLF